MVLSYYYAIFFSPSAVMDLLSSLSCIALSSCTTVILPLVSCPYVSLLSFLSLSSLHYSLLTLLQLYYLPFTLMICQCFFLFILLFLQEEVNSAKVFKEVFKEFREWMEEKVGLDKQFLFVTCGDWDLKTMLPSQCALYNIPVPPYCKVWLNIKKVICA